MDFVHQDQFAEPRVAAHVSAAAAEVARVIALRRDGGAKYTPAELAHYEEDRATREGVETLVDTNSVSVPGLFGWVS